MQSVRAGGTLIVTVVGLGLVCAWWPATPVTPAPVIRPGSKVERCRNEVEEMARYWLARGVPDWEVQIKGDEQMDHCLQATVGR